MTEPDDDERPELRLALGMRGGVSLAVWIGGACAEIDELRGDQAWWRKLRDACGFSAVAVDVIAGASAGGLNGVLFASAIRHGFAMGDLLEVWESTASVDRLLRTGPPWPSLFDGDGRFLAPVLDTLRERVAEPTRPPQPDAFIDLQLAATLVEPIEMCSTSPSDEILRRRRSAAGFHFRADRIGISPCDDLDGDDALQRLALAARATSSFPVAFEPAVVRSSRPATFGGEPPADRGRIDCRGVFSESRGPARDTGELHPDDFVVADGGIVDNIPLGRALDAVAAAPARGPTRRVLVYLHPTGPAPPAGADEPGPSDRRGVTAVATGTLAAMRQTESIDRDLDHLEQHNRAVRMARMLRRTTLATLRGDEVSDPWPPYLTLRPAADAARLRALLDDPIAVLGEDPFPMAPSGSRGDDVWRAPLSAWSQEGRQQLDVALTTAFRAQLDGVAPERVFRAGTSALRRALDLTLEWLQALAPNDATKDAKAGIYHLRSVVGMLDRSRRLGWVVMAGLRPVQAAGELPAWCDDALDALDLMLFVPLAITQEVVDGGDGARAFGDHADAVLQGLVDDPTRTRAVDPDDVDLRAAVVERLVDHVRHVIDSGTGLVREDAALLDHVLRGRGSVQDSLVELELRCMPEHLHGAPHGSEIAFYRMSAAAETPLARDFTILHDRSLHIDARAGDGWVTGDNFLRPVVKLAGNELGNFSAFLDRNWRRNDWTWGRLDGASSLVQILIETAAAANDGKVPAAVYERFRLPVDGSPADVRRALTEQRQRAILEATSIDPATWQCGAENLRHPGSPDLQDTAASLVAAVGNVVHTALPLTRSIVGPLTRPAQAAARWFTRPTGTLPPRPGDPPSTTAAGVGAWRVWIVALVAGLVVAAIVWAAAANTAALLVGLVAGMALGAVPLGAIVWYRWRAPPAPTPGRSP